MFEFQLMSACCYRVALCGSFLNDIGACSTDNVVVFKCLAGARPFTTLVGLILNIMKIET